MWRAVHGGCARGDGLVSPLLVEWSMPVKSGRRLCVLFLVLFSASLWAVELPTVQTRIKDSQQFQLPKDFQHVQTGFALTGMHAEIDCRGCHVSGLFEALPVNCKDCHDGANAPGKPLNHLKTFKPCDVCHTTRGFFISAVMDHRGVTGKCVLCHDNISAKGKPVKHVKSGDQCGRCHGTNIWLPPRAVDHEQLQGDCVACHDGLIARGVPARHIKTSNYCAECHLKEQASWLPVQAVSHSEVQGNCHSCHDKPVDHPATGNACDNCHFMSGKDWAANAYHHDAAEAGATACIDCHNNSIRRGKHMQHIVSSDFCHSCHSFEQGWAAVAFVDHGELRGSCNVCHEAIKPADHLPTLPLCEICHAPESKWANVKFDHAAAEAECQYCHDNKRQTGKSQAHIATQQGCVKCHNVNDWRAVFDHAEVMAAEQACISCHNGTKARGKTAGHLPSTRECQACHRTGLSWRQEAKVNHGQTRGGCDRCHSLPAEHFEVKPQCESCHEPAPAAWGKPSKIEHANVLGGCIRCHKQPEKHLGSSEQCGVCHVINQWQRVLSMDHDHIRSACTDCHTEQQGHITTNRVCEACHNSHSWAQVKQVEHNAIEKSGECGACHKLPAQHNKPGNNGRCAACHSTFSWLRGINIDHSRLQTYSCASCHNGSIAPAPSKDHCRTEKECEHCHTSTFSWKVEHSDC